MASDHTPPPDYDGDPATDAPLYLDGSLYYAFKQKVISHEEYMEIAHGQKDDRDFFKAETIKQ